MKQLSILILMAFAAAALWQFAPALGWLVQYVAYAVSILITVAVALDIGDATIRYLRSRKAGR
jgi:hypothetical protein